jgi:hypothetical protein
MGARTPTDRAAYKWYCALLFGLVEPPPRSGRLVTIVKRLSVFAGALLVAMSVAPAAVWATPFTVESSADAGAGTLRQAILSSNNGNPNSPPGQRLPNTIQVQLSSGQGNTISVASALPQITYPVVLNGAGATVADTFSPPSGDVLDLAPPVPATGADSSGSSISGLTLQGASAGAGLGVFSSNDTISGDTFTHSNNGVVVDNGAANDTIGGTTAGAGNVISGNTGAGVMLSGSGTNNNLVEGNYIGTDPTGTSALGNGEGVLILGGAIDNTIGGTIAGAGNVISSNSGDGVEIDGGGVLLTGNNIGVDSGGFAGNLLPNGGDGVQIRGGSGNTIDGGVIAAGSGTLALDAGGGANHLLHASLIGGPGPLIGGGASLTLTAGQPMQQAGATVYPVTVSGGQANDTVAVSLLEASCTGQVARLQFTNTGTIQLGSNGSGTGTVTAPNGPLNLPVLLPDGQTTGVNNLADPCGGTSPPPPPLACPPLPKSPSPNFVPSAASPDGRWLDAVFHDLLGQMPTPADLNSLTKLLKQGVPREQVVNFLEGDPDRPLPTQNLVGSIYEAYLNRAPSASELSSGVSALTSGETVEQLRAAVLGSPEFSAEAGGTHGGFVGGLYGCLLRRSPSNSELQSSLNLLAGGQTDAEIASTLLSTTEYRTDLVDGWYLEYLRRAPDGSAAFFENALASGKRDQQVIAALLSSPEYWHEFNPPTLVEVTVTGNGSIKLSLSHAASITMQVFKVVKPGTPALLIPAVQHAAPKVFKLPKLKRLGLVSFGRQPKGLHTLRWDRRVRGKRLPRGSYELVIQVRRGGKLIDISDAIPFKLR